MLRNSELRVIGIDQLRPLLDRERVIECVREALIRQAGGEVQSPPPGHLLFNDPPGDCHIKYAYVVGSRAFAIKIATGFYENPCQDLPVNNGLILVLDARTGAPRVLLRDNGWLTAWRTAAATVLAAATLAPMNVSRIGVIGAGLQARLAIEWLPHTLGVPSFVVWARNAQKAQDLAAELMTGGRLVRSVAGIEELVESCRLIITATPSATPLFAAKTVRPGTHLVGVGADSRGKHELPSGLFTRAAHVLTDDHAQCLEHGDFGNAVRVGAIASNADVMLGDVLSGKVATVRKPGDITVVDLTGIAAEDIAVAELFCSLHQTTTSRVAMEG
jgi:ornithine cyclodeaminase